MNFSSSVLFASLFWGSAGAGYFIYGKKQRSWPPMIGGVVMIGISYVIGSALLMSFLSMGVIAGVYVLLKGAVEKCGVVRAGPAKSAECKNTQKLHHGLQISRIRE